MYQCKTQDSDIWTLNDTSVPKGWRIRKILLGNVVQVRLLSPDGMTFQARRSALKYMIDEKYPEKEIEEPSKNIGNMRFILVF